MILENLVITNMVINSFLGGLSIGITNRQRHKKCSNLRRKYSLKLEADPVVCADACKKGLGQVPDHAIGQIKVQRKHCGPEEATRQLKDAMRLAHSFCSNMRGTQGGSSIEFLFDIVKHWGQCYQRRRGI